MNDGTRYGGVVARVGPTGEYAFIDLPHGGVVFVHRNQLLNASELRPGDQVVYSVAEAPRGLKAVEVEVIGGPEDRLA